MSREKKKRIENSGDISFGGDELVVSLGAILGGRQEGADTPVTSKKQADNKKNTDVGKPADIGAYLSSAEQATLHRESAGRGGKTVVIAAFRPAPAAEVAALLAKSMRKRLGCGSHVEEGKIVLQGDIQDRAEQWLAKQGVKKIVRGN